jgi:hypothetical protein
LAFERQPLSFNMRPTSRSFAVPALPSSIRLTARAASAQSSAESTHPHQHPLPAKLPGTSTRASIASVDEGETSVLHDRAAMHSFKLRLDLELSIVYFPAAQCAARCRKQAMPGSVPVVSTVSMSLFAPSRSHSWQAAELPELAALHPCVATREAVWPNPLPARSFQLRQNDPDCGLDGRRHGDLSPFRLDSTTWLERMTMIGVVVLATLEGLQI